MKKAADQGHAQSMFAIGNYYSHGLFGLPKDRAEAVVWFRKAAELGFPLAEDMLGAAYEYGQGVERDPAQAKHWYQKTLEDTRKEAEQGDAAAQLWLGQMYERGFSDVQKNTALALYWYRKAAQQDGPLKSDAQSAVARLERDTSP
ncbi:tetratricopeptide repeat protein [Trinickia dinghuensis]|uniref:Sel1 repeat family protein n=1 Tax=Trinickia dinghuensis TaxID=2291023 RepID=A0A3D8K6S2_9BURK|nr:tetratricopeptide repeat protein [Trinickia dinghuensis]RDV00901.1 sel1 repeat family protein [Trinickia dinghuensis]